jgi:hypothetical protein
VQSGFISRPSAGPRVYTPFDYGAVGDGVHDDGPALNRMWAAVGAKSTPVVVDWRGSWHTSVPIDIQAPARSEISSGTVYAMASADLAYAIDIDVGTGTNFGMVRAFGETQTAIANRNVTDGIILTNCNSANFAGLEVRYTRRYGIKTGTGYNAIGARLGAVRSSFCGASGVAGAPASAKISGTISSVTREGSANSTAQRALIVTTCTGYEVGDYLLVDPGGQSFFCRVESIDVDGTRVYPWPGTVNGAGTWNVEAIVGAGLGLFGGNTTQLTVGSLYAQYCGHALQVESLYGCVVGGLMGEVVGSTLIVGARNAACLSLTVSGFHAEVERIDVIVGGLSVTNASVTSPTTDIVGFHVKPTLNDGTQSGSYSWPLVQY